MNTAHLRKLSWVIVGQGFLFTSGVVTVLVCTRLIQPALYGELAVSTTLVTFHQQLIFGPVANGLARYLAPAKEARSVRVYMDAVLRIIARAVGAAGVFTVITALLAPVLKLTNPFQVVLLSTTFAVISGSVAACDSILNAAHERRTAAVHQIALAIIRPALLIGALILVGRNVCVAIAAQAMAAAIILASEAIFVRSYLANAVTADVHLERWNTQGQIRDMWKYSLPFAGWGVFTWCQLASDKWALQMLRSSAEVGLYQAVYQIGYVPISMAGSVVSQLLAPYMFSIAGRCDSPERVKAAQTFVNRAVQIALASTIGLSLLASVVRPALLALIPSAYANAIPLLPLMTLSAGIFAAAQLATMRQMSTFDSSRLLTPKIVTATVGVVANCSGAYLAGSTGVVYVSVLANLALLTWIHFLPLTTSRVPAVDTSGGRIPSGELA